MKKRTKGLLALMLTGCIAASGMTVYAEEVSEEVTELDIFINMNWWPIDSWTGIIPEEIEARTGVKLNLTVAADTQQLGLMIASNELPDLIFTDQELNRLSSENFCYSYDELIEQYAPEFQADELRVNIARSLSEDGKYYTLLNCLGTNEEWEEAPAGAPGQACIYYRKDIYEAIGSPDMETTEDFMAVCAQVKEQYPEMIPFGLGGYWKLQPISSWLGSSGGNTYQMLDDGSVVHYVSAPEYKEYMKYANTLAREGYISAEAYANENEADSHQMAYNGECFAYTWYLSPSSLQTLNTESQNINPDAEWAVLEPLGGENAAYNTSKGWAGTFISKSCKNPEAAIKLVEFLFSEEGSRLSKWGREGIEYTLNEDGLPEFSEEWKETKADPTLMNQKYNQYFYFGVNGVYELLGDYMDMAEDDLASCTAYKEGYKNYPEIGIATPASSSDEGIIEAKLKEMLKSEEAKLIFSADDDEFEKNYENLMENAEKIGVNELNAYMTEKVAEIKAEYGL